MNTNTRLAMALGAALLVAACTGASHDAQSQAQAQTQDSSQSQAGGGEVKGVKQRVSLYDSHVTAKPATVTPGMYQFETSDTPVQVVAWYKAHIPRSLAGKWAEPDPDAAPEWGFRANLSDGKFNITIQPVNKAYGGYSAGSKTIIAVT